MEPVWAVLCGTIRDEAEFSVMLTQLIEWRNQGKIEAIIFSTWKNEVDKVSELRNNLKKANILLVESTPIEGTITKPDDFKSGSTNYFRQSRQLKAALESVPDDKVVLKTRTDRAMKVSSYLMSTYENAGLRKVDEVRNYLNLTEEQFPYIFKHQIRALKPKNHRMFQFTDFAFMGYCEDIKKLVNFEVAELQLNRGQVANAQFFTEPFLNMFNIFKDFYRIIDFRPMLNELPEYTKTGHSEFPEFFIRLYTAYFAVLAVYFDVRSLTPIPKKVTGSVEFKDFFYTSHNRFVIETSLGTSIESYKILRKFISQSPNEVHDDSTKKALSYIRNGKFFGGTISNNEFKELLDWNNNRKDFISTNWLRASRMHLVPNTQAVSTDIFQFKFPGIIADKQTELWNQLRAHDDIATFMFHTWLRHYLPWKYLPFYVLSGAKSGRESELLMISRLLRTKKPVSNHERSEMIRVLTFHSNVRMSHNNFSTKFCMSVLNYYKYCIDFDDSPNRAKRLVEKTFKHYFPDDSASVIDNLENSKLLFKAFKNIYKHSNNSQEIQFNCLSFGFELTHDKYFYDKLISLNNINKIDNELYHYSFDNDFI